MKKIILSITILVVSCLLTLPAVAQMGPGGPPDDSGRQGFPGGRGMMGDPQQMQQMMSDRLRDILGISEEEWTVIGPKVLKVLSLNMESRGNPMRMFLGRPGSQGPGGQAGAAQSMRRRFTGNTQPGPMDLAMEELQKLLEDENSDAGKIKQAVTKIRKEREKNEQEIARAKKELRELLSVRQEAILISMGLLD